MKGSDAVLAMLKKYSVEHVFGLVGETTFPLYESWERYPEIKHILARDERNAAIMADGYSRAGSIPGVCEVPGVGASYILPGVIEAQRSGTPMIILSSDISLSSEKKDYLTEYDKSGLFQQITKEFISVNDSKDIPRLIRRAFRVATAGRMGPVFLRFPMNVYLDDVDEEELYAQETFSQYPSLRFVPDDSSVLQTLHLLKMSRLPVIVAGQGVLHSHAEMELQEFASVTGIPVGTTISGKGAVSENWELSLGVVGSRGGTDFSNNVLSSADLVFFIGTNTDSASTSEWKNPPLFSAGRKIIHLDVSEMELGNNYPTDLFLYGDAKLTLLKLAEAAKRLKIVGPLRPDLINNRRIAIDKQNDLAAREYSTVNPIKLVKAMQKIIPERSVIAADPGVGAIYSSAYFKVSSPGRKFIFNYAVGGLGFSLPAAIGAFYATKKTTFALTTDGSFGFFEGELETLKRYEPDLKVIIINNGSFGWIRATMLAKFNKLVGENEFAKTDYSAIAKGHGIPYALIERDSEIEEVMKQSISSEGPFVIEVVTASEDRLVPPVPEWRAASQKHNLDYMG